MKTFLFCALIGIVLGTTLALMPACTKDKACELQKTMVDAAAASIGKTLSCDNPNALKPYLEKVVAPLSLCESAQVAALMKGPIGSALCGPVISIALGAGVAALPADAKCSGGASLELVKAAAIAACESLLPI